MVISTVNALQGYSSLNGLNSTGVSEKQITQNNFSTLFDSVDQTLSGFSQGKVDAQSVVEAISSAELALMTATTIRDQVVGAYQELLRMPL